MPHLSPTRRHRGALHRGHDARRGGSSPLGGAAAAAPRASAHCRVAPCAARGCRRSRRGRRRPPRASSSRRRCGDRGRCAPSVPAGAAAPTGVCRRAWWGGGGARRPGGRAARPLTDRAAAAAAAAPSAPSPRGGGAPAPTSAALRGGDAQTAARSVRGRPAAAAAQFSQNHKDTFGPFLNCGAPQEFANCVRGGSDREYFF